MTRSRRVLVWGGAVLLAGTALVVGRLGGDARPGDAAADRGDGYLQGYAAGLQDGVVQGRLDGRVQQEGSTVPEGSRQLVTDAFRGGYAAGANDVFAGYDGGWGLGEPYVVSLEKGAAPVAYGIATRTPMQPGISYFLCPDGKSLCQAPRP